MKTITIKAGLAAALAATAFTATPALAANGELPSVAVRYSDLDLSTQEGQETLERRLERAAEEVCGIDRRTLGSALPTAQSRSCYRETVENFKREIAVRVEQQQRG